MPTIVGVHGIAQQFGSGPQLTSLWFDAIRGGLEAAEFRGSADGLMLYDLRVAFFGDLFRPVGTMAGTEPPYAATDLESGLERDLIEALYLAAVEQDPTLGRDAGAMGAGRVAIQVMLERLARCKTFANVAQRALIGNIKQVTRFLGEGPVKDRVLERVHAEVAKDTRVLVGHSLGSVVAYEYLCRYRPPEVELLVTIGSPLGIPNLIFDRLTPAPVGGLGHWPGPVGNWVNVADADDIVALRKRLSALFTSNASHEPLQDRLVDNGSKPHAFDRYLNSRAVGEALGAVL